MLFTALTATAYLPTNTSAFDSPWVVVGLIIGVAIVLGSIAYQLLTDDDPIVIFFGLFVGIMVAGVPPMIQTDPESQQSRDNLIANVKTVYDIDGVKIEEESPLTKLSNGEPISVTITSDSKAYRVLLSQNNETFEPSLSSYEQDSIDIETLKRDRQ